MPSPREIDAMLAEFVFGWKPYSISATWDRYWLARPGHQIPEVVMPQVRPPGAILDPDGAYLGDDGRRAHEIPHYSTEIADAYRVIEKMKFDHCAGYIALTWVPSMRQWRACFDSTTGGPEAFADDAPMAIALAALKSVGVEVENV